ncbi:hypothetical protein Taro_022673 [Colocasia esculenta]|uniref:Uncharacterized protein n=1 Tax=Colocasia esculenta TaxID=4460 RepID=A0A843V2I9_COLES|nr:hypothetical protein [Colocasia esculenta]
MLAGTPPPVRSRRPLTKHVLLEARFRLPSAQVVPPGTRHRTAGPSIEQAACSVHPDQGGQRGPFTSWQRLPRQHHPCPMIKGSINRRAPQRAPQWVTVRTGDRLSSSLSGCPFGSGPNRKIPPQCQPISNSIGFPIDVLTCDTMTTFIDQPLSLISHHQPLASLSIVSHRHCRQSSIVVTEHRASGANVVRIEFVVMAKI